MDFFKKALMVLGVLWLIGFVSMFFLGWGVYSVATSDAVHEVTKEAKNAELREHNEQMNREAAYSVTRYENDDDY